MRLVVLLTLVQLVALCASGCQLVFDVDGDGDAAAARRPPFTAQVVGENRLEFTLPETLAVDDYVIGTMQSTSFSNKLVEADGWDQLDDFPDGACTNAQWHTWIVGLRVADRRAYRFEFESSDDISALFVPYVGVAAATFIRNATPMDTTAATEVVLPSGVSSPRTIIYVSVAGDAQANDDVVGMVRVSAFANIVAFDQDVPDGDIPEIAVPIPAGLCMGVAQVKIER